VAARREDNRACVRQGPARADHVALPQRVVDPLKRTQGSPAAGFSATESAEGTESCRRGECAALALPQPSNLQIALFVCDPDSKTGVPERKKGGGHAA